MMPGGLTEARPATPEIQKIADEIKPQLEAQTNETYNEFEAEEYKSQVVAGTNFYIKIRTSNNQYVHVKVFKSLPVYNEPLKLVGYQTGKTKNDELSAF
ncbi:cystatin-A [Choloepus didactylus]|uniref:cystatin-A n=1 Tax=Choloepus didactylus TaxID=27675 RepID=UPI0001F9F98B|nr:cystatin-A [Choloepus didactylus]